MRTCLKTFSNLLKRTIKHSSEILIIHHYVSRRWGSFGLRGLVFTTARLLLKTERIWFGFGLAITVNMNTYLARPRLE